MKNAAEITAAMQSLRGKITNLQNSNKTQHGKIIKLENEEHHQIETNGFLIIEVRKFQNEIIEMQKKYDFQTKIIKKLKYQLKVNSNE